MTNDPNQKRAAWEKLCEEQGWQCRICGAVPEIGAQFERNLCDDCRITLKNEEASNPHA